MRTTYSLHTVHSSSNQISINKYISETINKCSEQDDSAAWNHMAGSIVEPLPVMAAAQCAGRGPIRALDSDDDTASGRHPRPHHGIYKRTGREAASVSFLLVVPARRSCPSFLSSFLSARSVWLGIDNRPIHLLAPPFFTNSPADSAFFTTSPPFSAHLLRTTPLSSHWLLTPPKSLPSCPMVTSHSLDRCELQEVPRSKRRCASCQGGIAQWSIPPKRIGGAIGQSCKVFRDR